MTWEVEHIGPHTLYRGDCLTLRPDLQADAVVSDPPYGIGFDCTKQRSGRKQGKKWGRALYHKIPVQWQHSVIGDGTPFDPSPWLAFPQIILWGANHFASRLPDSAAWLIWDKREHMTSNDFADAELAWTNLSGPARVHRQLWNGLIRRGVENGTTKLHPMQKPLALMRWCVEMTSGTVLDPYAGSGTTLVACVQLGRVGIGVEISQQYFDLACQRLHDALAQPDLFSAQAPTPMQQPLFAGGR